MSTTTATTKETVITGDCVYDKNGVQIFELSNGKFKGFVKYKGLRFETTEADSLSEARGFTYFILHEMSEII